MKIYVSHSRAFDYLNELYKPLRESHLNSQYDFFLPHENGRSINTEKIIKNSALVVAETSFPSTGQGIELGWAQSSKIPIVCFYKEGSNFSDSLKYMTKDFVAYKDEKELISKLKSFLESSNPLS